MGDVLPRSYAHAVTRPEWLDLVSEEAIESELPVIDPHHHLWHHHATGRYMPEQLRADLASGHWVAATVFVQCGWCVRKDGPEDARPAGETEAVNAVAVLSDTGAYGSTRVCAGIVGWADLRSERLDAVLDAHEAAAGTRFRGIRQGAAFHPAITPTSSNPAPPGLLRDPRFQRGLRHLGERGLTFDAWQYHTQLDDLLDAVRAAPGTMVVIDHVGGPLGCGEYRGERHQVFRDWNAGMRVLAGCPNVHVKLGGLGMRVSGFDYHDAARPPTSVQVAADWGPWIKTCVDLFGAGRCMFESNFPVDKGMCSYTVLWNAFKRIAHGASEAEKADLFSGTARRFYRLDGV